MAVLELFSKREKNKNRKVDDVYQYDNIPTAFKNQVYHILKNTIGPFNIYNSSRGITAHQVYIFLNETLAKELGLITLGHSIRQSLDDESLFEFFLNSEDYLQVLDIIELSFMVINASIRDSYDYQQRNDTKLTPDEAIEELNARFKEHSLGYKFEEHQIFRIDSEYIHQEVVKPVLLLLHQDYLEGANDEFLSAHKKYLHGNYKDCISDCSKAFESTLKSIIQNRNWDYQESDSTKKLIEKCFQHNLFPPYFREHLESGIPKLRNRASGHGQGTEVVDIPQHFAEYALNWTASTIKFLAEADKAFQD